MDWSVIGQSIHQLESLVFQFPSHRKVEITFRSNGVLVDSLMGVSWRLNGHWTWERIEKEEGNFGLFKLQCVIEKNLAIEYP